MNNSDIKELREKLGLTTQQLADKIGVTRYTINRWEKGLSKPHPIFAKILEELKEEMKDNARR